MQLKLPVEVHLAVGDDGMMLVIGGLIQKCTAQQLEQVLHEKPLTQGNRKSAGQQSRQVNSTSNKIRAAQIGAKQARARIAQGLCRWCEHKAVKGRKICKNHLATLQRNAADARAKKAAAGSAKKVTT